jgi:flavodoxin
MKTLVAYYSNTGSNKYLAEKIAQTLAADIEPIKPRLNIFPLLMIFSLAKKSMGIKTLKSKINEYDRVIVCSPIWMGGIVSPLRDFINKNGRNIKRLYFATCCGGGDTTKDTKFGYATVFNNIKKLLGNKFILGEAFSIDLVMAADQKSDSNAMMKTRLSDNNFTGEIKQRFDTFIQKIGE